MAGIEMRDLFPISQGSIYEQSNTSYKNCWNLVISDNSFHQLMNNAIVVLVKVDDGPDVYDDIHIKFESRGITYKILTENICNLSKNKLGNYIGTVSGDVLKQTLSMVQKLIFGEQLYTLSEARWNLADRDLALKAKYGQEAVIQDNVSTLQIANPIKSVDNEIAMNRKESNVEMSLEDEMRLFASKQDDYSDDLIAEAEEPIQEQPDQRKKIQFVPQTFYPPEDEILYPAEIKEEEQSTFTPIETPSRIETSTKEYQKAFNEYFNDKNNVETFLLDYYSMDLDNCKAKYPWIRNEFSYVAQKCRKLYIKNGGDKTVIDSFMKDKRQKAAKKALIKRLAK